MEYNQFLFNELLCQSVDLSNICWDDKFNMLKELYLHWQFTDQLFACSDTCGTVESIERWIDMYKGDMLDRYIRTFHN